MSSFIQAYANSLNPIYLSINIRSLQANHFSLNSLVENFLNANIPLDIIAVQEIWQLPHPEVISIPNFNFIFKQRLAGRGGGIGFYLSNRLNYKIRDDLSFFQDKVYESLTAEISEGKRKFIITNIYRSPTPPSSISQTEHFNNFLQIFDENLQLLSGFANSLIFLDSNINLLNLDRNQQAISYLETIHNNSFLQTIKKPLEFLKNLTL